MPYGSTTCEFKFLLLPLLLRVNVSEQNPSRGTLSHYVTWDAENLVFFWNLLHSLVLILSALPGEGASSHININMRVCLKLFTSSAVVSRAWQPSWGSPHLPQAACPFTKPSRGFLSVLQSNSCFSSTSS